MGRLLSFLWTWIDILMAVLMLSMITLVFTNVVMRYGFSSGLRVSVELSRLAFVWIVMIGAVSALKRGEHLGMPEVAEKYFPRWLPWLNRLSWLVVLGTAMMLVIGSWRVTVSNWVNISPLTGLPLGLFYLSGVVCGVAMVVIALVRLVNPASGHLARHDGDVA
ncbi:TRAP transporter small permease [Rhizobium skierniewicense]|uniref:TRAP transporter small permease n=1 Tax=Rhizobium skierniewicense TaxID=984260 RepID=UPI001FADA6FB|nr:TRAP transporter small permease [Rhizobium skierniewicense]MCI9866965.1 TRAP transporter small permease [Rhizobium skierniewicense]